MQDWFKFYGGEFLIDPKISKLTTSERMCWVILLCYASTSEVPGEIKHLSEYELMVRAGLDPTELLDENWTATVGILAKLEGLGLLKRNETETIIITNYRKKQGEALTVYERVKKHREKKRNETEETKRNENDNDRIEENRKEENKDTRTPIGDADTPPIKEKNNSTYLAMKALLQWAEERKGGKFVNYPKQTKAMKSMRLAGISPDQIKERWEEMENEPFWQDKGFDFMNVANSFNKKR